MNLNKAKLTKDGKNLVRVLVGEYGMVESNAIKLLRDGGMLLATALQMKWGR